MNVIKNILIFIMVVILLISGINYLFIKDIKSLKKDDTSIKIPEKKVVTATFKINTKKFEKKHLKKDKKNENLDILDKTVSLKCYKGQKIREILDELGKNYNIKFVYEKDIDLGDIDIAIDIQNITLSDVLEILIADKGFIWYNKDNKSVRILRKLK